MTASTKLKQQGVPQPTAVSDLLPNKTVQICAPPPTSNNLKMADVLLYFGERTSQ